MPCSHGCCASNRDHWLSVAVRPVQPGPKVTVDHTDHTVNTVTEHWNDRQDVHVAVLDPVKLTAPKEQS